MTFAMTKSLRTPQNSGERIEYVTKYLERIRNISYLY